MAKRPKPWYFEERNQWFVKINGKRILLGDHPHNLRPPKKGKTGWHPPDFITQIYQELTSSTPASPDAVIVILDSFLEWTQNNRKPRTYDRYKDFCSSFTKLYPNLAVADLTSRHVTDWLTKNKQWNSTSQNLAITTLIRAFNWAVRNCGLKFNPLIGMEKPKSIARKTIISDEDFAKLLSLLDESDPFYELVVCAWDIGCRPQELNRTEARHFENQHSRLLIPTDEGKKEIARAIYLPTDRCLTIIQRLVDRYPTGSLFRNTRGNSWTGMAVKCRFASLDDKLGKRFRQYDFRRTWITSKIKAGVDSHVVAKLAGHKSTHMVDVHYSVIADDPEFMLQQSKK